MTSVHLTAHTTIQINDWLWLQCSTDCPYSNTNQWLIITTVFNWLPIQQYKSMTDYNYSVQLTAHTTTQINDWWWLHCSIDCPYNNPNQWLIMTIVFNWLPIQQYKSMTDYDYSVQLTAHTPIQINDWLWLQCSTDCPYNKTNQWLIMTTVFN